MADHAASGSFAGVGDPLDVVAERVAVDLGAAPHPFRVVRVPCGWRVVGPVDVRETVVHRVAQLKAAQLNAAFAAGAKWGAER